MTWATAGIGRSGRVGRDRVDFGTEAIPFSTRCYLYPRDTAARVGGEAQGGAERCSRLACVARADAPLAARLEPQEHPPRRDADRPRRDVSTLSAGVAPSTKPHHGSHHDKCDHTHDHRQRSGVRQTVQAEADRLCCSAGNLERLIHYRSTTISASRCHAETVVRRSDRARRGLERTRSMTIDRADRTRGHDRSGGPSDPAA